MRFRRITGDTNVRNSSVGSDNGLTDVEGHRKPNRLTDTRTLRQFHHVMRGVSVVLLINGVAPNVLAITKRLSSKSMQRSVPFCSSLASNLQVDSQLWRSPHLAWQILAPRGFGERR